MRGRLILRRRVNRILVYPLYDSFLLQTVVLIDLGLILGLPDLVGKSTPDRVIEPPSAINAVRKSRCRNLSERGIRVWIWAKNMKSNSQAPNGRSAALDRRECDLFVRMPNGLGSTPRLKGFSRTAGGDIGDFPLVPWSSTLDAIQC